MIVDAFFRHPGRETMKFHYPAAGALCISFCMITRIASGNLALLGCSERLLGIRRIFPGIYGNYIDL